MVGLELCRVLEEQLLCVSPVVLFSSIYTDRFLLDGSCRRSADTIQRSINADPEQSQPADADSESASLITSLRSRVASQAEELEGLQEKLTAMKRDHEEELRAREEEVRPPLFVSHFSRDPAKY